MKRVLQIVEGMDRGGIETFIMNIYRILDKTEVQFDFLVYNTTGDYESEIEALGGHVYRVPGRNMSVAGYYKGLDRFFAYNAHRYVAAHQHVSALFAMEPLYYARKYGIPVRVVHAHNSAHAGHWAHGILHRITRPFINMYATHFLGCSDKAIEWMYKTSPILDKAEMINNGIDTRKFAYNAAVRSVKRAELQLSDEDVVWGHIGRFVPVKNHQFLLDIFEVFRKKHRNAKLLLIGKGEMLDAIKERVMQSRLSDAVIFLGLRTDIAELMQAMDVFVMPSLYEGLPVTLVEAQTAGLPVFAADTISQDVKLTPHLQFLSLHSTPQAWSNAIETVCNNFERCDVTDLIRQAGFDIKTTADRLLQIYNI